MGVASAALLAGCATATGPSADEFAGYFAEGFEVEAFYPCGLDEEWWVTNPAALSAPYRQAGRKDYEKLFVVVRGTVGPAGKHGHMGAYEHELTVTEVVRVDAARQGDCD